MPKHKWLPVLKAGREYAGYVGVTASGMPMYDGSRDEAFTPVFPSKVAAKRAGNYNVRRVTVMIWRDDE